LKNTLIPKTPVPGSDHRPADRVEALLYDWVNLPIHAKNRKDLGKRTVEYDRMLKRYPEMFDFSSNWEAQYPVVVTVRGVLQDIWDTRDARRRDWLIFELRDHYQRVRTRSRHGLREVLESVANDDNGFGLFGCVPEKTMFEAAMFRLQSHLVHRMLHCPNPDCLAPYFFRQEIGQKSCSPECGDYLRRQSRLRSYHKNKGKGD
jgi:hypothetical protein